MEMRNLRWIGHASFIYTGAGFNIFIDPFNIGQSVTAKADLVLITHAHFDHCSPEAIQKVSKPGTQVIAAPNCFEDGTFKDFETIKVGEKRTFRNIEIQAVPAYNLREERLQFHPKGKGWVGYVLREMGAGNGIYHAGDTDLIPEMGDLKALEAALLPMGGHYVMDVDEAIAAVKIIKPKFAVPMHYKQLLGKEESRKAEEKFKSSLQNALILTEIQEAKYSF